LNPKNAYFRHLKIGIYYGSIFPLKRSIFLIFGKNTKKSKPVENNLFLAMASYFRFIFSGIFTAITLISVGIGRRNFLNVSEGQERKFLRV
jgi:hypothetical protein